MIGNGVGWHTLLTVITQTAKREIKTGTRDREGKRQKEKVNTFKRKYVYSFIFNILCLFQKFWEERKYNFYLTNVDF